MKSTPRIALSSTAFLALALLVASMSGERADAQTTPNLVSACSGVSLPPSDVTNIMAPVINGIASPIQNTVNPILSFLGGAVGSPLNIDTTTLLNNAASGQPITLQVLNSNGTVVGPSDRCDLQADSYGLNTQGGISIGGNRITGLGTNGLEAQAGELNSIAFGNSAITDASSVNAIAIGASASVGPGAAGGMALGSGASVTSANSVALGAGSVASRGALSRYAALGLVNPQTSYGEISVGAPGAERQITNVAAGSALTDAVNVAQLQAVTDNFNAFANTAVTYDSAAKDRVTLAGTSGTTLTNVAPGALGAGSTDAVNGAQLFATNVQVGNNTTAITNLTSNVQNGAVGTVQYSNAGAPTVPNGGTPTNDLTLVGATASPVALHNVAAGSASTDAVNVAQLQAVAGQVGSIGANAVQYDGVSKDSVTLGGAGGTTIANVKAATLDAASTQAVNGSQLYATNVQVANNSTAITNLSNSIANGSTGPVQYSNPASPTVPNGGTRTNDLMLIGASSGAVGLHNVGDGSISAGSTDAVNGGQVYRLAFNAVNAVSYDMDVTGGRSNSITLSGGDPTAPVAIRNLAAGTVATGSTDAVNGGQLYATNMAVTAAQATADTALTLGRNSVQYDNAGRTDITLGGGAGLGGPVALHNVAPGVSPTDAVNLDQLNSGLGSAVAQANAYTDARFAAINYNLRTMRRDAYAGTAGALAAAGLPQAYEAGKGMIAMGGGTYAGEGAFALGFSKAMNDGHTVVRLGGSYDTRGRAGASGGIGYQF